MIFTLMPIVFLIAIIAIAFEDKIHINKAAVAVLSAVVLWGLLLIGSDTMLGKGLSHDFNFFVSLKELDLSLQSVADQHHYLINDALVNHLGNVASTLFFVIASMIIIDIIDQQGGFRSVTNRIRTRHKRSLLVALSLMTFFLSSILNNLATIILMIAILRKFITDKKERWVFASMMVIAANAGGSWSPIGDVTTLLLWTNGALTPSHQVVSLFLPALATLIVPLFLATRYFAKNDSWKSESAMIVENNTLPQINDTARRMIFIIGVLSLALVPVFNQLTGLPPYMGVLLGLAVLWVFTDLMYYRTPNIAVDDRLSVDRLSRNLDMPTIMFFFGILMSVSALDTAGQLAVAADVLNKVTPSPLYISVILGLVSSVLDNVALVAGALGMYPIADSLATIPFAADFVQNGSFWTLLAYCCVTGGSILIIGSATGVAVMGLERISFGYYFRRFTHLALAGYISGIIVYFLQTSLFGS